MNHHSKKCLSALLPFKIGGACCVWYLLVCSGIPTCPKVYGLFSQTSSAIPSAFRKPFEVSTLDGHRCTCARHVRSMPCMCLHIMYVYIYKGLDRASVKVGIAKPQCLAICRDGQVADVAQKVPERPAQGTSCRAQPQSSRTTSTGTSPRFTVGAPLAPLLSRTPGAHTVCYGW